MARFISATTSMGLTKKCHGQWSPTSAGRLRRRRVPTVSSCSQQTRSPIRHPYLISTTGKNRHMYKTAIATIAAAMAAMCPAAANDSSAELGTGGLTFVRNDDVEMRSEDLSISTSEVKVRYRFFNKSDKDVTILVAFPMPEIKLDGPDDNIAIPTEDPVNLLAFSTIADGRPVTTKVEQRVYALGLDRTQMLRDLAIPLAPHLQAASEALDKRSEEHTSELQS